MRLKKRFALNVETVIPVIGGMWDGSGILMRNLTPGVIVSLNGARYVCVWENGKPMMKSEGMVKK